MLKKYRDLFIKGFVFGTGVSLGLLVTTLFAVEITGKINKYLDGELLSASKLNENFNSIKTSIESIPDWKKNGNQARFNGPVSALALAGEWDHSTANGGYVDIGQMRIQWGIAFLDVVAGAPSALFDIRFPAAFANSMYSISFSPESLLPGGSVLNPAAVSPKSKTGCGVHFQENSGEPLRGTGRFFTNWIAVGAKP